MTTTRREFLAAGAAGVAAASVSGPLVRAAFGAPEREIAVAPAVVVLYLRGGQDQLNAIVPYTDGRYYDIRPRIRIQPPGEENGALPIDDTFGFHPNLVGMKKLFDDGHLAPIINCGSHHPTRSHFDAQDFMEYGAPGDRSIHQGWMNRFLETTSGPGGPEGEFRGLAMQGKLPRSLHGRYPVLAVPDAMSFDGRGGRPGGEDVLDLFEPLYKGPPSMERPGMEADRPDQDPLIQNGQQTIRTLRRLREILNNKPSGKEVTYPQVAGRLGQQLKRIARVLKSGRGLQCAAIDWNGWDHHINQGTPEDGQPYWEMLKKLDAGVTAFMEDIAHMRSRVVMLVMTEFGRTNAENGNLGTDHGHGGIMWAIGGKVKGGKIYGEWPGLAPGNTYQNRDLLVSTDFRTIFSELLHNHLGLHPSKNIFPGFSDTKRLNLFAT